MTASDAIHDPAVDLPPAHDDAAVIPDTGISSTSRRAFIPLLLLITLIVIAAIVRIVATRNDLWLDELISLRIANTVKTPWQIFTAVHNDNNHYLNSLYLYVVRKQKSEPLYRYFSVLLGVALVPAGYWLLALRSRVEAVILAVLLACSYPLIHFSSEARGYSGALLGSMLACAALIRWMAREKGSAQSFLLGLTYAIALSLAILFHLTACLIWLPLAAGSLITLLNRPEQSRWIRQWVALNFIPACVLAVLYSLDLQFLTELGGSPMTVPHALGRLLALALGWPAKDAATACIVLVPLIGLIAWRLAAGHKSGDPLSILLALVYLMPLLCVLLLHPTFFSPRYFLVFLPFVYVGLAMLLARLVPTRPGRLALGALLALFLAGQAQLYAKFLQVGRGQFTAALQYMVMHTPGPKIVVASNQDFRSSVELAYFAPRLLKDQQLLYVPRRTSTPVQPEWYILHQDGYEPPGPATLNMPDQPAWYRVAYSGASELSGQAWTLYTHEPIN